MRVLLNDLASMPQYNGTVAKIISFNAAKVRWNVKTSDGQGRAIKPDNVFDLPNRVEYNEHY